MARSSTASKNTTTSSTPTAAGGAQPTRPVLPTDATLVDLLRARAAAAPARRAFTFLRDGEEEWRHLSYGELDARARDAAARLAKTGIAGKRALLLHPPGLEFIVAFLGCLYAGVTAVPAYPPRSRRGLPRLAAIVRDARPALALTTAGEQSRLARLAARVPGLGDLRWEACGEAPTDDSAAAHWVHPGVGEKDLAFLQYTSGSTATPRGVRVSHGNLMQNEAAIHRAFEVTPEAVIVSWLPLYHDMGLIGGVLQPLYAGAQAVLMAPVAFLQRPARWLEAIGHYRATISGGPDFAYDLCARQISPAQRQALVRDGLDLAAWRVAFNGAEPVRAATLARFSDAFSGCGFQRRAFFPCYGLAESTLFVSGTGGGASLSLDATALEAHVVKIAEESADSRAVVSCGHLGQGQRAQVVDPLHRQPVDATAVGEIWLAGPSTTDGYWQRPAETRQTFAAQLATGDGPYLRTGDLGFLRNGELFVTGRLKDLIVIRGRNCYPQDLEQTAEKAHLDLRPGGGAAFSMEHDGQERLVLLHEVKRRHQDATVIAAAIRGALAEEHALQVYEVVLLRLGTLPRTSSGKVQRHACRQHYLADTLAALGRGAVVARSIAASPADAAGESVTGEALLKRDTLLALTPSARQRALERYLGRRAARAAGMPDTHLDRNAPLVHLGLDSLAAISLTHDVATDLGVSLPVADLLAGATLTSLAQQIGRAIEEDPTASTLAAENEGAAEETSVEGEREGVFPLADGQRGLCFLDELAPRSAAYVMAVALRIHQEIEVDALRHALQGLVARHDALRTTLHARTTPYVKGSQPHQQVHHGLTLTVPVVAAADWSDERLEHFLDETAYQPFDLDAAPLMRATVIDRGSEHIVLVGIHHAVADFWSLTLLARDLGALYAQACGKAVTDLAPPPVSYGALVGQQEAQLAGAEGERLWDYWQRAVGGADTVLALPTDRPRPAVMTHSGGARNLWLGREIAAPVRALARVQGVTLYTTLLATFAVLLHRLTGQDDFLIGSPTAGRDDAASAPVVGYFVNPVVMRADLRPMPDAGAPPFTSMLARTRQTVLGALAHQRYPLLRLTERLQPQRDPSRSALFQVMFVLQRVPHGERQRLAAVALGEPGIEIEIGPHLTVESMHLEERASPFELVLRGAWIDGEILLSAHYNTDLFDPTTMARLLRHYRRLLAAVAADPSAAISALPLLDPVEAAQIVVEWNDTASLEDRVAIDQQVAWQAARTPDAPAVIGGNGVLNTPNVLSYSELLARADHLAHHLRRRGIGPETRVGVLVHRTPALVTALLGVLRAGAAYVPLDPAYPQQRLAFMLADSRAAAVVAEGKLASAAADTLEGTGTLQGTAIIRWSAGWSEEEPRAGGNGTFDGGHHLDSLAYILYTSGSTGRPKGVAIPHRGPAALAAWARRTFPRRDWLGVLAATSICFDLSVFELFVPLTVGGTVVLAENALDLPSAATTATNAGRALTLINTVPSVLAELLRLAPLPPSVRTICLAGEPLPRTLVTQLYAQPDVQRVFDLYGPSEDTTYSTGALQPRTTDAYPTIGRPLAGGRASVLDRHLRPVPIGVVGELCLAGDGLARGYFGQAAQTAARFVPDPSTCAPGGRLYRSGDRARQRPDGALLFLGRSDHQVKLRGFRIELGEVEAHLAAQPEVDEAVVLVDHHTDRLVAFLAMNEAFLTADEDTTNEDTANAPAAQDAASPAALRARLRQHLPAHMVPAVIDLRAQLPRLPNGKLDRRALRNQIPALALDGGKGAHDGTSTGVVEEILAAIWTDLLGGAVVGPDANFFDLGGHSLLATRMLTRLREALAVELPLLAVFEAQTLRRLTTRVEAARAAAAALPATPPLLPREEGVGSVGKESDTESEAPASYAQERLWFFHRLAPTSPAYNLPAPLRLRGPLDTALLARAIAAVIARHEALRTVFIESEDRAADHSAPTVRQRVGSPPDDALPTVDLRALSSAAVEANRLAVVEVRRPFDLAHGPLLRLLLLRLKDDEHLLIATFHHIVADAWSLGVWWREVWRSYQGLCDGQPAVLPPLPVQYSDFAHWQRQALQGTLLTSRVDAWRQRLDGLADLVLPTDRPRPTRPGFRGDVVACDLPADLHAALEAQVRRAGVTLYMVLLAGLQTFLYRLSGQRDMAVGAPVAGRDHSRVEGLIGFFVNTVVLRGRVQGGEGFHQLLGRTRRATLDTYALQDTPFEKLVEALAPQRQGSTTPLFQVALALQNAPRPALTVGALTLEPLELHTKSAKFDLTWIFEPALAGENGLRGRLEYDTDLFDPTTARRFAAQLRRLLAAAVANPERALLDLPLLSPAAVHQLTVEHARGVEAADRDADLPALFAAQAAETPDAPALLDGAAPNAGPRAVWTYGYLAQRATVLARRLRDHGVGKEDIVGLYFERGAELVMAMLAVVEAGGAYLPLAPDDPPARRRQVLDDAEASLVLTHSALRPRLPDTVAAVCSDVACSDEVDAGNEAGIVDWRTRHQTPSGAAAQLAYVIYTSGSTGRPKGVAIPHRAIVRLVRRAGFADLGRTQTFLQLAPPTFDAATLEIWGPLLNGGRLVIPPPGPLSTDELRRLVARHGITTLWLTSGLFHRLAVGTTDGLQGLRQLLAGGDVTQPAAVRQILRALPRLTFIHGYGPTENTTFTTCCRLRSAAAAARPVLPLGQPIAGTDVLVLDHRGQPVAFGVPGELTTGGDGLARGYLRRPARTAAAFRPHPLSAPGARLYYSGDRVRRCGDGRLEFLGRADAQVKVRGFRIEPGEVETTLGSHPMVGACAVAARPDPTGDKRLIAWVVPTPGQDDGRLDTAVLADHLATLLPPHLVPDLFVPLSTLPLTANGKVNRQALAAPTPARPVRAGELVAPRSPHEAAVAAAFAVVLGLEAVGADDDFFTLGGNSLAATRVVARLRRNLGVEVPLAELFATPTVAGLAATAVRLQRDGALAADRAAPIPRCPDDTPAPLSYAQARLWLVDRLRPGGHPGYVVTGAVTLRGALRPALLAGALQAAIRRHETLRTTFAMTAEGPVQLIAPAADAVPALPVVDLGALPTARQVSIATGWGRQETRRPFDLERGPLLRPILLRRGGDHHVLWTSLHHAIADGWSVTVLIRELVTLYRAAADGTPNPLPALPIQYADYAHWQRSWLERGEMSRQLAAWRQRLAGMPALELPTDRPRPTLQSGRGGRRPVAFSAAHSAALEALAARHGTTLFVTLMAAFQTLLHRLSGQSDIAVGFPIAGRTRAETEGLVGCLVNVLVLRGALSGDPPFHQLMRRFHAAALEAYAHQDVPFERLVEEINPQRDLSQNPLVQVTFGLQNAPLDLSAAGTGLQLARLDADPGSAALDLYLSLWQDGGALNGHAEYDSDLFDATTVERLVRRYTTLLDAVIADPETRLSCLRWLATTETHQLVTEWNDTGRGASHRLTSLLEQPAAVQPDAVALVTDDGQLSFGYLARHVDAFGQRLRAAGVGPETLVGVALARGRAQVTAVMAVLEAGGAYVPLDPDYPAERLALLVADSRIAVVIARRPLPAWLGDTEAMVIEPQDGPATDAISIPKRRALPPPDASLAYAIYTSGSTGRPKGVMIGRHHLAHFFAALDRYFGDPCKQVWICLASLSFDISVVELLWTLSRGARVVIDPRPMGGEPLVARLEAHRVTHLQSTPPLVATLALESSWGPRLAYMRRILIGGEVWPARLAATLRARTTAEVYNTYGPTEVTIWTTYHRLTEDTEPIPIGRSVSERRAYVVDRGLRPTPLGIPGALYLGGEGVARGYLRRPGLSAARFVPDPWSQRPGRRLYCTGDVARWRHDGVLDFLGRDDRQVKIRGYRIELGEVEVVARRHPTVAEAAAVAWGQGGDRRLVLYVSAAPEAALEPTVLRTFLAAQLPAYMVPGEIPVLDALPRMPNGKTDYHRLPSPETAQGDSIHFTPPQTAVEEKVAAVWRRVLGRRRVGVDDSFFEIGGSSLSLVRVHRELEAVLGRKIDLVELFRYPSVGTLATFLDQGDRDDPNATRRDDAAQQRGDERGRRQHDAVARISALAGSMTAARQQRPDRGTPTDASPADRAADRHRLPNGLEVVAPERGELLHFYDDIFVQQVYLRHDIALPEDAVVFDVGANIGLFTLFVQQLRPHATIFAFEPVPPLYALLQENARRHAPRARLFRSGVDRAAGQGRITFYPRSTGMSSFHAHEVEERALLTTLIRNEAAQGVAAAQALLPHLDDYVAERLRRQTFDSPLTTLSTVIRQQGVERIDLLKIDAQKSEAAIIAGIDDDDWPRLRQIVLEVHDTDDRLAQLTALLTGRGFAVTADQEAVYADTGIHLLYARRQRTAQGAATHRKRLDADALARIRARARAQRQTLVTATPQHGPEEG